MNLGFVILFAIVGSIISAVAATERHRNVAAWFTIGALFPLIGVITIMCLPPLKPARELA